MSDNILDGFVVMSVEDIPSNHGKIDENSELSKIAKAFLETDSECIAKEYSSREEARSIGSRLKSLSQRSDIRGKFDVSIRCNKVYLYKTHIRRLCPFCNRPFISQEVVKNLWTEFCPECTEMSKKLKLELSRKFHGELEVNNEHSQMRVVRR